MPLVLALEIDGAGADPLAPRHLRHVAEVAERAGFTLVTIDDDLLPPDSGAGRTGAVERAAFVAAATSVLGVAPVVSTTYSEPFHVSTQLASVDHVSSGRAGWVVAASPRPEAAAAWGRPPADPVQEAVDAVRVVRALWDSWEDDAVIRDVATGRYLDRERLHFVDFEGAGYSVKGPAIVPRPPQGQPVVFAPRGLVPDREIDVALVGGGDVAAVRRATAATTAARTFAELDIALDTAEVDGADRRAALDGRAARPSSGRLRYTGGPNGLVTLLRELEAAGVHGVRIHPLALAEDLPLLSQFVVPALIRAGLATRPPPGATLRAALGLPRPLSRFATTGGRA